MSFSHDLFAYIDPVSGVILLQLFIGGGIACVASFHKKIWRFASGLFSKKSEETVSTESNETPLMKQPLSIHREAESETGLPPESSETEEIRKAA
jgi:hypothetical protein